MFAGLAPAQTQPVELPRVVVSGGLLTESAATVSVIDLASPVLPAADLSGVAGGTANFFVAAGGARSFTDIYALRGLTNTPLFGDPAVSLYLDDLPLGSAFTFPTELFGFGRMELHRGPTQNTVFGRAGAAGVITLATPEPGAAPAAEIRAGLGDFGLRYAAGQASTAAGGTADAYAAVHFAQRDGYLTNTALGRDVDYQASRSALTRLRWRPQAGSEITLLGLFSRARDGSQPLVPLGGPFGTVQRSHEGRTDLDAWNLALTAVRALPCGRLSATLGRTDWALGPYRSVLRFGPFAELDNDATLAQRNWTAEVKLVSGATAAMRWSAGAFAADGRTDGMFVRAFGPFVLEKSAYVIDADNQVAFGEATRALDTATDLTAGLRLERNHKTMRRAESVPSPQFYRRAVESTAWLPKLGLSRRLDADLTAFVTAGAGFKPGGFSAFTGNAALAAFGPERTRTLEAGLAFGDAARPFSSALRAFFYDIRGYQIERSFATSSVADDYLVVNAPRALSWGGEAEFRWQPAPALLLSGSFGVTHAVLRRFTDPYTGASYAGRRAPAVPLYDASLRAEYRFAGGFFVAGEASANGRIYYTEAEDIVFGQRAYLLGAAQVGYARGQWRLSVRGDNLGNARYYSAMTPGAGHGTPGAPRRLAAEVVRRF
jgi:outer membrane receptor protein involved in Fe transport